MSQQHLFISESDKEDLPMAAKFVMSARVRKASERSRSRPPKVNESQPFSDQRTESLIAQPPAPLTVSAFLDVAKELLGALTVSVRGEVSSVSVRERAIYFSLTDADDGSVLPCVIFPYDYRASGVHLNEGMEVIAEGVADIYKPMGKFSFKVKALAQSGEGSLRLAYEKLKAALAQEGLFDAARKRPLSHLPEHIALITSRHGAAMGDVLANIGTYGLRITHIDARVEGAGAVRDVCSALASAQNIQDIDAIMLVRGGGSLESLQAFNNESVVRAIASSRVPVVCGIGHEQDETLATLVADIGVSTPTAAARVVRTSWDGAAEHLHGTAVVLCRMLDDRVAGLRGKLMQCTQSMTHGVAVCDHALTVRRTQIMTLLNGASNRCDNMERRCGSAAQSMAIRLAERYRSALRALSLSEQVMHALDPQENLRRGYAIARTGNGKAVRSVTQCARGAVLTLTLCDGDIRVTVV